MAQPVKVAVCPRCSMPLKQPNRVNCYGVTASGVAVNALPTTERLVESVRGHGHPPVRCVWVDLDEYVRYRDKGWIDNGQALPSELYVEASL